MQETVPMEFGPKKKRELPDTEVTFCTDVVKLVNRSKKLHDITADNSDINIKIGCGAGQGVTKITLQILDIACNTVKHTIIIAATKAPGTTAYLRFLIERIDFEKLQLEFKVGVTVDVKVLQVLYGIMGGKAKYPCPLCLWPAGSGLTSDEFPLRTIESITRDKDKLEQQYRGDSAKHAKDCNSVEAYPILKSDPHSVVKFPTVHAHLLVNTIYKAIKTRCVDDEEREEFDQGRRGAGVRETTYHGTSLEGKSIHFNLVPLETIIQSS